MTKSYATPPRLSGVREHHERARFFYRLAGATPDNVDRFRLLMAAIYSCRGIVEILLELAERQEFLDFRNADPRASRKSLELHICPILPYYGLVERIRIHDFHRFGLSAADPDWDSSVVLGPIKLIAHEGGSTVSLAEGLQETKSGKSRVDFQRPLVRHNDNFLDDETSTYVPLDHILTAFLSKVPNVLEYLKICNEDTTAGG